MRPRQSPKQRTNRLSQPKSMAESNTGNRLDDHEQRLARPEAARHELEDSFVVVTHLETKAAARVKEHAEFIAAHEAAVTKQAERDPSPRRARRQTGPRHRRTHLAHLKKGGSRSGAPDGYARIS